MKFQSGVLNPRWNGGRWVTRAGYVWVRVPVDHPCNRAGEKGYAPEHLLNFWKHHRRLPRKGFHVHHKDEDKEHNHWTNLQEKRNDTHGRLHLTPERAREIGRKGGKANAQRYRKPIGTRGFHEPCET